MENCFTNFVGVIDSGVGGLTILKQLQRDFPICNFVYIADSLYCPYGTKQPNEILFRAGKLIGFLQRCGVQSIVIACNTASVHADTLRQQFNLPIYDVITPTCMRVVNTTKNKRVALLGTNATVNSGAYQHILNASGIEVVPFHCSQFVPFVENNKVDTAKCDIAVHNALCVLPKCNVDTVILGCTHFPLLRTKIAPYICGATIVECCTDFQPLSSCDNKPQKTVFLTTGVEKHVNNAVKWFGKALFSHIEL